MHTTASSYQTSPTPHGERSAPCYVCRGLSCFVPGKALRLVWAEKGGSAWRERRPGAGSSGAKQQVRLTGCVQAQGEGGCLLTKVMEVVPLDAQGAEESQIENGSNSGGRSASNRECSLIQFQCGVCTSSSKNEALLPENCSLPILALGALRGRAEPLLEVNKIFLKFRHRRGRPAFPARRSTPPLTGREKERHTTRNHGRRRSRPSRCPQPRHPSPYATELRRRNTHRLAPVLPS